MRSARLRAARTPAVVGIAALAFLHLPVLVLAAFSFNDGAYTARFTGASLRWYERLLDPAGTGDRLAASLADPFARSLRLAAAAAFAAVLLSSLLSLGLRGASRGLVAILTILWSLPLVLPDVVLGVAWRAAFDGLGVAPGFAPLFVAHASTAAAFGLVVVRARLHALDPSLVEAARDLGASRAGALRHVVIPHLRPALLATAILAFTLSFDDFTVSFFLASPAEPTLPVRVYGTVTRGASPVLNALATLSLAATFALGWIALRLAPPEDAGPRARPGGLRRSGAT